jgi:hypothetical protein
MGPGSRTFAVSLWFVFKHRSPCEQLSGIDRCRSEMIPSLPPSPSGRGGSHERVPAFGLSPLPSGEGQGEGTPHETIRLRSFPRIRVTTRLLVGVPGPTGRPRKEIPPNPPLKRGVRGSSGKCARGEMESMDLESEERLIRKETQHLREKRKYSTLLVKRSFAMNSYPEWTRRALGRLLPFFFLLLISERLGESIR